MGMFARKYREIFPAGDRLLKVLKAVRDADGQPSKRLMHSGFPVAIETARGETRHGPAWNQLMANDYGYIEGVRGADGDSLDVFIGNESDSPRVYVIDQVDPETGRFDEHKVVLGVRSVIEAENVYRANYASDWLGLGAISECTKEEFQDWLRDGDKRVPFSAAVSRVATMVPTSDGYEESEACGLSRMPENCPGCGRSGDWFDNQGRCGDCGFMPMLLPQPPNQMTSDAVAASSMDAGEWDLVTFVGEVEIVVDSGSGGKLLRARQKAMYADRVNINRRYYPASVVQDAVKRARENARAGVMLSEFVHPAVVKAGGIPAFVDNPNRKTATVDDIGDVGPDGSVWITRTIKDTVRGRQVADAIRRGVPFGLSSRMRMEGHMEVVNGEQVKVADRLEIHTWDDVENPAFADAGREVELLTDSVRAHRGLPPVRSFDNRAQTPANMGRTMEDKIKAGVARIQSMVLQRKPAAEIRPVFDAVSRVIEDALALEQTVDAADMKEMLRLQPYTMDRPGLVAIPGNDPGLTGMPGSPAPEGMTEAPAIYHRANEEANGITHRSTPYLDTDAEKRRAAVDAACDQALPLLAGFGAEQQAYIVGRGEGAGERCGGGSCADRGRGRSAEGSPGEYGFCVGFCSCGSCAGRGNSGGYRSHEAGDEGQIGTRGEGGAALGDCGGVRRVSLSAGCTGGGRSELYHGSGAEVCDQCGIGASVGGG